MCSCRRTGLRPATRQSERVLRMGKPVTLLESLCAHGLSFEAQSISVERKEREEWVFIHIGDEAIRVAKFPTSGSDAEELRGNLDAALKKPVRAAIRGKVLHFDGQSFGEIGRGLLRGRYRPRTKARPDGGAAFHSKAGTVSGLHLPLHENSSCGARRVRPRALFPGLPAFDPLDDQDAGAQRTHRKNAGTSPIHSFAGTAAISAATGIEPAQSQTR